MELEALRAFGLTCNVLQAIDFGLKTAIKVVEYERSRAGYMVLTVEFTGLNEISKDIATLCLNVRDSLQQTQTTESSNPLRDNVVQAIEICLDLANEFLTELEQHQLSGNANLFKKIRSAVKFDLKRDKFRGIQLTLAKTRSNLHIAFILYALYVSHGDQNIELTNCYSKNSEATMAQASNNHEERIVKAIVDVKKSSGTDLTTALSQMDIEDHNISQAAEQVEQNHAKLLEELSTAWESSATISGICRTDVYNTGLALIESAILSGLYYTEVQDRYDQIDKALDTTFVWAEEHPVVKNWLASSNEKNEALWIAGKPGSGKSTFLRHLEQKLLASVIRRGLPKASDWCMISYYFWAAGTSIQRSREGFLRTVLFQLLFQYPRMILTVTPDPCWKAATTTHSGRNAEILSYWSETTMRQAILQVLHSVEEPSKVVIIVDGLDELQGEDAERYELLQFLSELQEAKCTKLLVSSRPWPIFTNWFKTAHQFNLEDMTANDIRIYVRTKLVIDPDFVEASMGDTRAVIDLMNTIVQRAEGVFLWVYLVVRDMLMGVRRGDCVWTLRHQLDQIPRGLSQYFKHILESIPPSHAPEVSAMLQVQLRHVLASQGDRLSLRPPTAMEMSFLNQYDKDFVQTPSSITFFEPSEPKQIPLAVTLMRQRVNNRCMGLLTARPFQPNLWGHEQSEMSLSTLDSARIHFFHRTIADFLVLPENLDLLQKLTNGVFATDVYRLCAYLTMTRGSITFKTGQAALVWEAILLHTGRNLQSSPDKMDAVADYLIKRPSTLKQLARWFIGSKVRAACHPCEELSANSLMVELAIKFAWIPWLNKQFNHALDLRAFRRPLHFLALPCVLPAVNETEKFSTTMTKLLKMGADPNERYLGSTVWAVFLVRLRYVNGLKMEITRYEVAKMMLENGARNLIRFEILQKAIRDMYENESIEEIFDQAAVYQNPSALPGHGEHRIYYTTISLLSSMDFAAEQFTSLVEVLKERSDSRWKHPNPSSDGPSQEAPNPSSDGPNQEAPNPSSDGPSQEIPNPSSDGPNQEAPNPSSDGPSQEVPNPSSDGPSQEAPNPSSDGPSQEAPKESARKTRQVPGGNGEKRPNPSRDGPSQEAPPESARKTRQVPSGNGEKRPNPSREDGSSQEAPQEPARKTRRVSGGNGGKTREDGPSQEAPQESARKTRRVSGGNGEKTPRQTRENGPSQEAPQESARKTHQVSSGNGEKTPGQTHPGPTPPTPTPQGQHPQHQHPQD